MLILNTLLYILQVSFKVGKDTEIILFYISNFRICVGGGSVRLDPEVVCIFPASSL